MSATQIKMTSEQIKKAMETKTEQIKTAYADLSKWHVAKSNEISKAYGNEMCELNVQLRAAEAEEAYEAELRAQEAAEGWKVREQEWIAYKAEKASEVDEDSEEDEGWNVGLAARQEASWQTPAEELCYHCGADEGFCSCGAELVAEVNAQMATEAVDEQEDEPCYDCGRWASSCACVSQLNPEAEVFVAPPRAQQEDHREGTKLKWVSSTNPETYSVAIVKKDGILEVKRVTDGGGLCHDTTVCQCVPCSEIRLSDRLGVPRPPWRSRVPLLMTFFETEAEWRASLPGGGLRGSIQTTVPAISARQLKKLCCKPLSGATDALKLKELQERFPGGTIVLSTDKQQLEIEHVYYDIASYPENWCHQIYSRKQERAVMDFSDLGVTARANGKPQLMALWKGLYIDLSHLF